MTSRSPLSPPRVALVGVSGYGQIYWQMLSALWAAGRIALQAVVIINQAEEAAVIAELRRKGCAVYDDFEAMLRAEAHRLDLCCLPTGIAWHAPMTVAALRAGAHVLVEKPLAATLEEVRQIRATEQACGRWVAVGFQDITHEANLALKRALLAGRIGRVRKVRGLGLWPRDSRYYGRNAWAGQRQVNGRTILDSPINNAMAHYLNLALFFAGATETSSAHITQVEAELYRAQAIDNYDTVTLRAETREGVMLHFCASHSTWETVEPTLEIEGDLGRVRWENTRGIRVSVPGAPEAFTALPEMEEARRVMFERVIAKVADPGVFVCGSDIAEAHTRCIVGAQAAAIRNVPPDWIERVALEETGAHRLYVRDLERHLLSAFASDRLLSETNCPWATQAVV